MLSNDAARDIVNLYKLAKGLSIYLGAYLPISQQHDTLHIHIARVLHVKRLADEV